MKKRWKKLVLVFVVVVLVAQTPFIYHRFLIGRLSSRIAELNTTRVAVPNSRFKDFIGAIHVHTSLGGHSTATLSDLIEGSKGLDFVAITEHTDQFDTAALTLNGTYGGVLFVGGNELDTLDQDRLLMIPGTAEAYARRLKPTKEFLPVFQQQGRLIFVTYPDRFNTWDSAVDGMEVFNLNTSAQEISHGLFLLDALWTYGKYPELTLARHLLRPDTNLQKYDSVASRRRITLFAGSDAHSNIGFHLFSDDSGHKFLTLKFDDYATIFRIVRTHVLLEPNKPLTQENLIAALRAGHCYVGFDVLSDSKGFSFSAGDRIQGDEVMLSEAVALKVSVPQKSRIVLFKDGRQVSDATDATELKFEPKESGAYRVEVFLESLGEPFDRMPWILSNPIYVK